MAWIKMMEGIFLETDEKFKIGTPLFELEKCFDQRLPRE